MVSLGSDEVMQFMPVTVVHETDNRLNKCRTIRTSDGCLITTI
jgi:hypothetical protein